MFVSLMKDPNPEPPSENLASHYKQKSEDLAFASNEKLRTLVYRVLLSESKSERSESDWMLLVAGGSLALILPNAKDLLEVYNIVDFKIAAGLLLISGTLGFLAKSSFRSIENAIGREGDPHSKDIGEALVDYVKKFSELKDEAAQKGITVEIPESSFKGMFDPLQKLNLQEMQSYIASEIKAREKDPHYKWQKPVKNQKTHSRLVLFQTWLLITAFLLMLLNLHPAK